MALLIRSSAIHAAGCYTTAPIRRGKKIVEYTGRRITCAEGDHLYEGKDYTYLFGLRDGKHLIDGHGMAAFLNHSCDPNCETDEIKGRVWIIAARDIRAGEELTYDYNLYDGVGEAPCYCGAAGCRGTMYSPSEIRKQRRRLKQERVARISDPRPTGGLNCRKHKSPTRATQAVLHNQATAECPSPANALAASVSSS